MKTGLLSIKRPYAEAILDGRKRYEFRRRAPKLGGPVRFLIYVPGREKKLVGAMIVNQIFAASPRSLWNRTKAHAGIRRKEFMEYFEGRNLGYALAIDEVEQFDEPASLDQIRERIPGHFYPPQYLLWVPPEFESNVLS